MRNPSLSRPAITNASKSKFASIKATIFLFNFADKTSIIPDLNAQRTDTRYRH